MHITIRRSVTEPQCSTITWWLGTLPNIEDDDGILEYRINRASLEPPGTVEDFIGWTVDATTNGDTGLMPPQKCNL